MYGKNFSIYGVHSSRKSLNLCFFIHAPVPHSKLLLEFFGNMCPPAKIEGDEGSYDLLCQNLIRKYEVTWNISLFPFGMIAVFLNVMALQFCK